MDLSIALLQMGVKRLQNSILMNDVFPGQTPTELQLVLSQLAALERRCNKAASPMVSTNLADTIMEATSIVGPLARQVGRDIQLHVPQDAIIEGRSDDLRQMFCRMLEHSLAFGAGPIELHVRFASSDRHDRGEWITELFTGSPDLPDHLRRNLSTTVGAHGGETFFISEPKGCRIRLVLPAERRSKQDMSCTSDAELCA
jgi:hypothetical protein